MSPPRLPSVVAAALVAALLVAALPAQAGKPRLVAAFDDDASDAYGPGTYVPPGDSDITEADFDLRRFEVWVDGEEVIFKVTMGASFRQPGETARTSAIPLNLANGVFLQNIDIYIDSDPTSRVGFSSCIPGRRVGFSPGRTWKAAVVLTPQPGPTRNIIEGGLGSEAAGHVVVPDGVQTTSRTAIAHVSTFQIGGTPTASWAYSVMVSGARWERSFALVDRIARGKPAPDAFTMPVVPVREAWAFGGAPEGIAHPRVVDVLLPRGVSQKRVLGSFHAESGEWARVPFVSLQGAAEPPGAPLLDPAAAAAKQEPPPPPPGLKVVDLSEGTVTLAGPTAGISNMMIGQVLDEHGRGVAKVIVFRLMEGGLVASVLEGGDKIARGATVRFELQKR